MKVAFHTLGCKVNQYETEAMKNQFEEKNHTIVDEHEVADVYVINTCSVTSLADRKSRQYIRKMKKLSPDAVVAVTGCYAQVNTEEVAAVEGVNLVIGTNEKPYLVDYVIDYVKQHREDIDKTHVLKYEELNDFVDWGTVISSESRTRAYVKIQEGCNRFCTYCIIPYARGPVRSRSSDDIINECKTLVENGYKEIILTGINTALCENLDEIFERLEAMEGEFRVRLSSLEPTVINADYVKRLFKYKRLCHHLHLSLQAGSDHILSEMNRRYDRQEYLNIVNTLYAFDENYGITTDIIVGFPGETDNDFKDTLDIVEKCDFCKVHAFKYSRRKGTKAAEMPNQIMPTIKKERSKELIEFAEKVSERFFVKNLGTVRQVLFEEYDEISNSVVGYTDNYIRSYLSCKEEEAKIYINKILNVSIDKLFQDGVKVSLK